VNKTKTKSVDFCPIPPWTPSNIVKLAKYLAISQARLTEMMGISHSALRAWLSGRSKTISATMLARLKKFEKKIPAARKIAIEKLALKALKESRKNIRLAKPWPVSKIRSFMHTWGMSQAEFAIFCDVSYDSVTSWSRGRRRLVRRETAEHIGKADAVAVARKFPKIGPNTKDSPWNGIREYFQKKFDKSNLKEIPLKWIGKYQIVAVETNPGKYRTAKESEKIVLKPGKKGGQFEVKLTINEKKITLTGQLKKLGGVDLIALFAPPETSEFFKDKAGCINPGKHLLRISIWSSSKLPIRLLAALD